MTASKNAAEPDISGVVVVVAVVGADAGACVEAGREEVGEDEPESLMGMRRRGSDSEERRALNAEAMAGGGRRRARLGAALAVEMSGEGSPGGSRRTLETFTRGSRCAGLIQPPASRPGFVGTRYAPRARRLGQS